MRAKNYIRKGIFMIVICLLVASVPYVTSLSHSSIIKLVSLTVGNKTVAYENLGGDSLVEVDIQTGKEVQITVIAELKPGQVIKVHSGLCNSLLAYDGAEVLNKKDNINLMLQVTASKLVLRAYGTFNRTNESTVLLVLFDDFSPLLIIRSKSTLEGVGGESSEESIQKLKQMLNKADIPSSRKSYYDALLLRAERAYAEGRSKEANEIAREALEELEREKKEFNEVKALIEEASHILTDNLPRLPSERKWEAETKVKLALLALEGAKYEEARGYATEAKNLAMWTIWDELKTMLPTMAIIAVSIGIAMVMLHSFRKRAREKATPKEIPREVYGE
jgi:hypothetical protein